MLSPIRLAMLAVLAVSVGSFPVIGRGQCVTAVENTCSYTGLNGKTCTITIDRVRPAAPPTLYARKDTVITVNVVNRSPFETLSADITSAKVIVQPDPFQAFMASQIANLQKFNIVVPSEVSLVDSGKQKSDKATDIEKRLKAISASLKGVFEQFDISTVAPELARVVQPPTPKDCEEAGLHKKSGSNPPNPFFNTADWKLKMLNPLAMDPTGHVVDLAKLSSDLGQVDALVAEISQDISQLPAAEQPGLKKQSDDVAQILSSLRMRIDLITVLNAVSVASDTTFLLKGFGGKDDVQITWAINDIPVTSLGLKRVLTAPYKAEGPFDKVTTPPTKQPILSIPVQYQSVARLEFSTGIMVPFRPFHSYSTSAVASGGVVTGNVIQENLTYTVVPLALVNIGIHQGLYKKRPVAFFGTIGTGYNPTSSSVEFGVGPSFSWRAVQISALADIGRDTQLAGGFFVNEPLPVSNPPKPLTVTVWSVKPAFALSVRIPLGGTSK
jgi:hypothetical protein